MLNTDAGPQQTEVVVHLGDRADSRSRILRRSLLIDRNGRRQTLDDVHIWLVHLSEELASVGAQRLDITALTFGVNRVEGQTALSRSRETGQRDQPIARDLQIDVLEIVLTCTTYRDPISLRSSNRLGDFLWPSGLGLLAGRHS